MKIPLERKIIPRNSEFAMNFYERKGTPLIADFSDIHGRRVFYTNVSDM